MARDASDQTSKFSRYLLIAALVLAVVAVGVALMRNRAVPVAAKAPEGTPAQIIAGLEARLKAEPNDARGWRMLGWSFFQTGRYAEATSAYARATQLDPADAALWSSLGEARVLAGPGNVPAAARSAFQAALTRDPKDARARYFLAVAKDMDGDHRGAIDDWFALLAASPADAPWYADVRKAIEAVAAKDHIDVAPRLAALRPAAPTANVASAAIPGPTPDQMRAASALPPGQQQVMVDAMVAGLAAKLRANPGNVDGWIMLMRSYTQLGRGRDARAALASARAANPAAASRLNGAAAELGLDQRP